MKQFFLTVLGVFTGLVLFVVVVPIVLITMAAASSSGPDVPRNAELELDLRAGLSDQPPASPFALFGGGGLSVMQVVDTLDEAEAGRPSLPAPRVDPLYKARKNMLG